MTQFTKTHGDFQVVAHQDTGAAFTSGSLYAPTSGAVVNVMGPKLDFITVTGSTVQNFTGANIKSIIDTVQQLAIVYMYQYTSTTNDTLALAIYPTTAWTATSLATALNATAVLGASGVTTAAGATFSQGL